MTELAFIILALAVIILALAVAIQTVRAWISRAMHRQMAKRWTATQAELDKAMKENLELKIQLNGKIAGEAFVKKYCDDWADIIE